MIKVENVETFGWGAAIRGMRNPMNSWDKSDSEIFVADFGENVCYRYDTRENFKSNSPDINRNSRYITHVNGIGTGFSIGENDIKLMRSLIKGGPVEAKFRRMIHVQMDITAPLYWWKEFDTYKVGTVANSCSTMHKIHAKEFTFEDFSCDHLLEDGPMLFEHVDPEDRKYSDVIYPAQLMAEFIIPALNRCREEYLRSNDKEDWWQMIQLLPTSYNQRRTVDLSYEVLANIYKHRKNHKLDEWRELCRAMVDLLPYSWIFTEEWETEEKEEKKREPEAKQLVFKIPVDKNGKVDPDIYEIIKTIVMEVFKEKKDQDLKEGL